MKYLRWLLLPFSLLYGLIVMIRNWLYDAGFLKSQSFNLPVISVGNLAVGGAGKSPMTEYLIRLLKDQYTLATLSRGYGRKTKGFIKADETTTATEIGDEPAQFKHKFPEITVAVCEDRIVGIEHLQEEHDLILMDDAYQHRPVKPGLSMLLFDYNTLFELQLMLPAGNLREPMSGSWRANMMVITKCPETLAESDQIALIQRVKPLPDQPVFFTSIAYLPLRDRKGSNVLAEITGQTTVFLLTGIARSEPMVNYIRQFTSHIIHYKYPDHHPYSLKNLTKLASEFNACPSVDKVIITTEKDAQRLATEELLPILNTLPVLVLPIGVKFLKDGEYFNRLISDYVRKYRKNNRVH